MHRPWHAHYAEGLAPVAAYPRLQLWELVQRTAAEREAQEQDVSPTLVVATDGVRDIFGDRTPDAAFAVLQFTSGTTGAPKGAMMTHANLVANALQNTRWFGWTADDVVLGNLPFCHTWDVRRAQFDVCGWRHTGAARRPRCRIRHEMLSRHRDVRQRHLLPSPFGRPSRTVGAPRQPAPLESGAMLTQRDLKARWDSRVSWAPLQQGYGLTEASPETHNNPPRRFSSGTVGVPIQDTDSIRCAHGTEQHRFTVPWPPCTTCA